MKRTLATVAAAITIVGSITISGCGKDGGEYGNGDSTAMHDSSKLDVDSGADGATEVSVEQRTFDFEGTVTAVEGDMVTIDHKAIGDYKPAGSDKFKLSKTEMAEFVEKGEPMQFTIEVVGDQALVTVMETAEDADDAADTIGSNSGVDTAK